MFSGPHSTHIPLGICSCTNHHRWYKYAGSHVLEHMHLNLEWDHTGVLAAIVAWFLRASMNKPSFSTTTMFNERNKFLTWACFLIHVQHKSHSTLANVRVAIVGTDVLAVMSLGTCIWTWTWTWKEKLTPHWLVHDIKCNQLAFCRAFGHSSL